MSPLKVSMVFLIVSIFVPLSSQQTLFSPITKDDTTNLYTMLIYLKTPLQPSRFHLDLGSYLPYYDCARHYKSSTYQPVHNDSSICDGIDPKIFSNCFSPQGPGCFNNSCGFFPENPVTRKIAVGDLLLDKFSLPTVLKTSSPGPVFDVVFSCTDPNKYSRIYRGLAKGSTGVAALGRFNYSFPAQLSRAFKSPLIFAICLPSSSKSPGVALFNSQGPYHFSPKIDVSKLLTYTPLILGPVGADTQIFYWYKSPDYILPLTSIKVNDKTVSFNSTLLEINENGRGGTKISSSVPYTTLQSTILKALVDVFVKESAATLNLKVIEPVAPFNVCFAAENVANTKLGPRVPIIDLVLQNEKVFWRVYGSNSMVRVQGSNGVDAWCLGFVDGGLQPRVPIVIGAHQLQDYLLQFDLENGRLGFSSSLLAYESTCSNFDFGASRR